MTTRAAIDDHALDLFLAAGYQAVSVADIIARCGISRPTFFRYVPHRDDIVLSCNAETSPDSHAAAKRPQPWPSDWRRWSGRSPTPSPARFGPSSTMPRRCWEPLDRQCEMLRVPHDLL